MNKNKDNTMPNASDAILNLNKDNLTDLSKLENENISALKEDLNIENENNIQLDNNEKTMDIAEEDTISNLIKENDEIEFKKYLKNNGHWQAQYEAVVGLAHRKMTPPFPCQDFAFSTIKPRPIIILADGAGSSATSDIGSQFVTLGVARLLNTLEKRLIDILDKETIKEDVFHEFSLLIVKHARGILEDLSQQHRRPLKDFRCTLLVVIVGKLNSLWLKVGDGALVYEKLIKENESFISELRTLGQVGKGEFANLTTFIDENIQPDDVQSGGLPSENICAFFAMSDGAADRFVSNDGTQVATRLSEWSALLRENKLSRQIITKAFYSDDFCRKHNGDDCSLALVSSNFI